MHRIAFPLALAALVAVPSPRPAVEPGLARISNGRTLDGWPKADPMSSDLMPRATVTRGQIARDLSALGLRRGDVVMLHSSLRSLGHVEGGAEAVIDAFLDVIGPEGTLSVPTIVHTSGVPRDVFDAKTTPSEVGAITEALRLRPDARRSEHPTHSVAAIGARAQELTSRHSRATGALSPWGHDAFGHGSPWDWLHEWDAKCVFLGVGFRVCTLFHYAQTRFLEAHQPEYAEPIPFPYFDHAAMGDTILSRGTVRAGRVGQAEVLICGARDIVGTVLEVLEKNPLLAVAPESAFATWQRERRGRALTLTGGFGKATFDIPGWPTSRDGTELAARVLVLRDADAAVALVSLTLIALVREDSLSVRRAVAAATGIASENIVIACTHVHSGPPKPGFGATPEAARVLDAVIAAASRAALEAQTRLEPVRLAAARRHVEGISRIRRVRMNDGRTYTIRRAVPSTWRAAQKPEYVGEDGILDPDLTVLRIEDCNRKPLGGLFHFACHPLPDFIGRAASTIESVYGAPFVCLPLNGAQGDVDTPFDVPMDGRSINDQLPVLSGVLSGGVMELLARAETRDGGAVRVSAQPVRLPVNPWVSAHRKDDALEWLRNAARAGGFETEVTALRLGELALVAIPGEITAGIGRSIKQGSPFPLTCPVGLANDAVGYILPRETHARGGYEADPRFWGLCDPAAADIVVRAAGERLVGLR